MNTNNSHPILQDHAVLVTRPLEEFINIIIEWLENLIPGGVIWGYQRVGKTRAIRYLMNNSLKIFGKQMPMALLSTWDPTFSALTENRFFGEVLRALGHAIPDSGTAAAKRQRIISLVVDKAQECNEHRFLLLIDEAQWLHTSQLNYLMDLHNQLAIQDIRLITILLGQPELMDRKQEIRNKKLRHLMGRFMTLTHQFEGVTGRSDFRTLLRSLDVLSEYPEGSEQSFTEYFIPLAFQSGWRLEAHSDQIWDVFEEVCRHRNVSYCKEWPMQGLIALLRYLLISLSEKDDTDLVLERADIEIGLDRVAIDQLVDHAHTLLDTSLPSAA